MATFFTKYEVRKRKEFGNVKSTQVGGIFFDWQLLNVRHFCQENIISF